MSSLYPYPHIIICLVSSLLNIIITSDVWLLSKSIWTPFSICSKHSKDKLPFFGGLKAKCGDGIEELS